MVCARLHAGGEYLTRIFEEGIDFYPKDTKRPDGAGLALYEVTSEKEVPKSHK
jgi:hypothetical protein